MISFDRVVKRYPNGREALSGVTLDIAAGEMVMLTGRSGAGKSTLLRLIALLERPTRGRALVNGINIGDVPAKRIPLFRRGVGMVFQDHKLLPRHSVFDNVALPLVVTHTALREIDKRVRAALDQVGLLGKERMLPLELSVGEQQRVGIARAIVGRPPLLIADEPTGNLDPELAADMMSLFRRLNGVGVTVLVATHDLHLVRDTGLREIILEGGAVHNAASVELPAIRGER